MDYRHVTANGIDFAYLEQGEGPLALLLHGFPEAPTIYRHLMPALAEAGYRAVAPALRGFAPTQAPPDGSMRVADLVDDANSLHEVLGGGSDAVLIGHDWGAITTWGAATAAPDRWSRIVAAGVPPMRFSGRNAANPALIQKNIHTYFFQMAVADRILPVNDFAYVDWMWDHWTGSVPGFDSAEDRAAAKDTLRDPVNTHLSLQLYRDNLPPGSFGMDDWELPRVAGQLPTQPTFYLHGAEDPVVDAEMLADIVAALPAGSDGVLLDRVGHFPFVELPDEVNKRIVEFLS